MGELFCEVPQEPAHTIFVVDDDDAVRDSISALLLVNDRKVHCCASADEFLACFDGAAYCLLLDVDMPKMTGLQLVRHLADTQRLPATVLLTVHAEARATQKSLTLGVHQILPKPAEETALLSAIDNAARAYKGFPS